MSKSATVENFWVQIHIAGNFSILKHECHKWCNVHKCCVTVTPTSFVYKGGIQEGATIRFIHYPKYPTTLPELRVKAMDLADVLMFAACQNSYTVEDSQQNYWKDIHLDD